MVAVPVGYYSDQTPKTKIGGDHSKQQLERTRIPRRQKQMPSLIVLYRSKKVWMVNDAGKADMAGLAI